MKFISISITVILLAGCTTSSISPLVRAGHRADYITMDKSDRVVTLWEGGQMLKSYEILSLGFRPTGHKVQEGDGRTPEGHYFINDKHPSERFQKFLNISYPNETDKANAYALGVQPGGAVGMHGDKGGWEGFKDRQDPAWTWGCISVRNEAIEEIYQLVPVGTEIFIQP